MFYGLAIGLGFIGAVSALLLAACTIIEARMVVYFVCVLLVPVGVVSLGLAIGFGYALPTIDQACAYTTRQFETSEGTVRFMQNMNLGESAQLFTNCLNSSSNAMMGLISPQFETTFSSLKTLTGTSLNFYDYIPHFRY